MLNIKNHRKEKGLSQAAVARDLGISRQTYNNYELGKHQANYEMLFKLARYFETTIDSLLGVSYDNSFSYSHEISDRYLSIAKEAEEQEISPEEIKLAIEFINMLRAVQKNNTIQDGD